MNRMISELADLGWVDFDFGSSAVSQILIGLDLAELAKKLGGWRMGGLISRLGVNESQCTLPVRGIRD